MLILERPWTRQPQGAARAKSTDIGAGLMYLFSPGWGAVDAASGLVLTPYGSVSRDVNRFGYGANVTAANSAYERVANDFAASEVTIAAWTVVRGTGTDAGAIAVLSSSGDSGAAPYTAAALKINTAATGMLLGHSIGGTYAFTVTSGGVASTVGQVEFLIGRAKSGAQNLLYYINGALFSSASGTVSGALSYSAGRRIVVGEDYRLASRNCNRHIYCVAVWGRYLPDSDIQKLVRDPWQLFAPQQIIIPTPAAAAAVPTLSASTYVPGSMTSTGWRPQITAS